MWCSWLEVNTVVVEEKVVNPGIVRVCVVKTPLSVEVCGPRVIVGP